MFVSLTLSHNRSVKLLNQDYQILHFLLVLQTDPPLTHRYVWTCMMVRHVEIFSPALFCCAERLEYFLRKMSLVLWLEGSDTPAGS